MAGGLAGTVGAPVQSVVVVGNRNDPDHAPILLQHMVAQTAKDPAKRFNPAMRTIVRWTVNGQFGETGAFVL